MIIPLTDAGVLAGEGVLALLCGWEFRAYENRYPFSSVFVCADSETVPRGGGMLSLRGAAAYARTMSCAREIADTLSFAPTWETLLCTKNIGDIIIGNIQNVKEIPLYCLLRRNPNAQPAQSVSLSGRALDKVYRLLKVREAFESWYCDESHRIRRGLLSVRGLWKDGELLSTLSLLFMGSQRLLWDAATREDVRGQGHFRTLCEEAVEESECLWVLTWERENLPLYAHLGFSEWGEPLSYIRRTKA